MRRSWGRFDRLLRGKCGVGLFVTWPTSYEALVGRAELKPGTCSPEFWFLRKQADSTLVRGMGSGHRVCGRRWHRRRAARERFDSLPTPSPPLPSPVNTRSSHPALGAKVIAAAGSQEKLDISIKYGGADHGVLYTKDGWQKEVLKLTGGKGVDVIYDPVGLIRGAFAHRSRSLPSTWPDSEVRPQTR